MFLDVRFVCFIFAFSRLDSVTSQKDGEERYRSKCVSLFLSERFLSSEENVSDFEINERRLFSFNFSELLLLFVPFSSGLDKCSVEDDRRDSLLDFDERLGSF